MATTRYFDEQVMRKRAYLTVEICERVLEIPLRREVQQDGRIRHWGRGIAFGFKKGFPQRRREKQETRRR
jgi:hypothetical protein